MWYGVYAEVALQSSFKNTLCTARDLRETCNWSRVYRVRPGGGGVGVPMQIDNILVRHTSLHAEATTRTRDWRSIIVTVQNGEADHLFPTRHVRKRQYDQGQLSFFNNKWIRILSHISIAPSGEIYWIIPGRYYYVRPSVGGPH